ncbi:MAG: hypothetical protein ACLRFG_03660 [Clostridia bacterium]
MKKKILTLILVLVLLPLTLTGCGESAVLNNFARDYNANIASNVNLRRLSNDETTGKATFEVEHFEVLRSAKLDSACNTYTAYKYLTNMYEPLVYDSLSATYFFAPDMINKKYPSAVQDEIYDKMDALFNAVDRVVDRVSDLERSLIMESDPASPVNLSHLKLVYVAYENLIDKGISLSESVVRHSGYAMSKALTTYSYTSGSTQTALFSSLIKENYTARLISTRDYFLANFKGNNVPTKIIKAQDGFGNINVVNTFAGRQPYTLATGGIDGTSTLNAGKIESNASAIKASIANYLSAKTIHNLEWQSYQKAHQTITYSQASHTDYARLSLTEQDALATMQTYLGTSADYNALLNTIINYCI